MNISKEDICDYYNIMQNKDYDEVCYTAMIQSIQIINNNFILIKYDDDYINFIKMSDYKLYLNYKRKEKINKILI